MTVGGAGARGGGEVKQEGKNYTCNIAVAKQGAKATVRPSSHLIEECLIDLDPWQKEI